MASLLKGFLVGLLLFSNTVWVKASQLCLMSLDSLHIQPYCTIGVNDSYYECLGQGIISVNQKLPWAASETTIFCTANYPFDFEMTSAAPEHIMEDNLLSQQRVEGRSTNIQLYTQIIPISNLLVPRRFTFYKQDDKTVNTSFFLIRNGELAFPNSNKEMVSVKSDRNVLTLPCIVSDPRAGSKTLKLKKFVHKMETQDLNQTKIDKGQLIRITKQKTITTVEDEYPFDGNNLIYDKTLGFRLKTLTFQNPYGNFSCVYMHSNPSKSEERFDIEISPPQDHVVKPEQNEVTLFQNGKITLSCRSKEDIMLVGHFNVTYVNVSSTRPIFDTHLKFEAEFTFEYGIGDFGNISCVQKRNFRTIHSWTINVLDMWNNEKLNMTIQSSRVKCQSENQSPKLVYIVCSSESNCRHHLPCFHPGQSCSIERLGGNCADPDQSCVLFSAEEQFIQGLIGCKSGDLSIWTHFLKGFDEKIYTDWRKAPASALLEIVVPKQKLYEGGKFSFTCRFYQFLSNGEVLWFYRSKNDTASTVYQFNVNRENDEKQLTTSVRTKLRLSSNKIASIGCSVPQWDGKAWNITETIEVERTEKPTIKSLGYGQKPIFVKRQTDRSLWCAAHGLPIPKINWFKEGTNLSKEFAQIQTNDEDNRVELKFPSIEKEHSGVYVCNASNVVSFVLQKFIVQVKDEKKPFFETNTLRRTFYVGDNEQLDCKVESYPRPRIIWGYPPNINNSAFSPVYSEAGLKTISSIRLNSISEKVQGVYNCTAINQFGRALQIHIVDIKVRSSPVQMISILAVIAIVLLLVPLIFVIWRLRLAKKEIRDLTKAEVEEFFQGNLDVAKRQKNVYSDNPMEAQATLFSAMPYKTEYEIPKENLKIDEGAVLGEGAFGRVVKAMVKNNGDIVAVKTVKPNSEVSYFKALLSELKIMIYLGKNANVINLIGAYTENIQKRELYIVVELCHHGSLEKYLQGIARKNFKDEIYNDDIEFSLDGYTEKDNDHLMQQKLGDSTSTSDLIRWSYQIACGMEYLAGMKVIHADLSTRNVLLHEDGTIRITDFGLSRQLYDYTQYVKKNQAPLPWRWMAIESLRNMTFSSQSDVWAFGVTMWEIFSLGDIPYPGKSWTIDFVDELTHGLRMKKPRYATYQIYRIMYDCWNEEPEIRPSFNKLKGDLFSVAFG